MTEPAKLHISMLVRALALLEEDKYHFSCTALMEAGRDLQLMGQAPWSTVLGWKLQYEMYTQGGVKPEWWGQVATG